MRRQLRRGAAIGLVLGAVGHGVAGAAPTPSYSVDCVVGVQTKVTWQRAKVERVTISWVAPAGSAAVYPSVVVPIKPHPPRGFVVSATGTSSTGVGPAAALVTFAKRDGTDEVRVPCN